jgi:hypothetical protein
MLTGFYQSKDYPDKLRRVKYYDSATDKTFVFPTNNLSLPAISIAEPYRKRWQVELFFKWIKQHLRIKTLWNSCQTNPHAFPGQILIMPATGIAKFTPENGF